ncbi:MAG TPA: TonB-dependent receptor [Chitinophagaceae bacterium]|nr:MAG: TonB-dependent receptor [Bacteroidetes bacterium OLB11]HMN33012.1 TonB-dependent receptor [Chitinophagaceae bacterium]
MIRIVLIILLVNISFILKSQNSQIKGIIKDSTNNELLAGVNIVLNNKQGVKTNEDGYYQMTIPSGKHHLMISYTGYEPLMKEIKIKENEVLNLNFNIQSKAKELNQITISGSKFAKRTAEEIVSIEVLKPTQVLNSGNNSMEDALQRVPGVDVIENQVNIRGGAGWSYGAGSRVLVLVDDMPMLTADAGDAKWDFLPLENCEQIEIIKGASSSLYGSSALNGIINFRTSFAKNKPRTKAMLYNGIYGNPKDPSWAWWGKQLPNFQGGYFMHSQKFGNLETVIGSAWFSEDSYLQGELSRRARVNINLRYNSKKIEGLAFGINSNFQKNKSQLFFFWQPDSNGTKYLQPYGGMDDSSTTINKNDGDRFNIDPYIQYVTKGGAKHILRTRFFRSQNRIPEKHQSSLADTYFGEYQVFKSFVSEKLLLDDLNIVSGIAGSHNNIVGELYGNHVTSNIAPYLQVEKKFNRLWLSLGARYEFNFLDTFKVEQKPVFRAGANYELDKATFLRASFGQGYRYPSIAERFVNTSFGASRVFPNIGLLSETGWSAEIGIKQGYKLGSWLGFIDIAGFWTEYKNMMEFNFGLHLPKDSTLQQLQPRVLDYIGFKSINVGTARINGVDISIMGQGKIGPVDSRIIMGYTYMNPIQVNPDSIIKANMSGYSNTLKYRYRHSFKFDFENSYKGITIGNTFLYNSKMQNIDEVFQNSKPDENIFGVLFELGSRIPSSVDEFRNKYNKGSFVWDLRLAYQLSKQSKLAFIIKNMSNAVYSERPAIMAAPRNYTLQLAVDI